MTINDIPEIFQSNVRLAIVTALISGEKNFKSLKEIREATAGNLLIHLQKLEEKSYILSSKKFICRKPSTTYALTETGRKEFRGYVEMLYSALSKGESAVK